MEARSPSSKKGETFASKVRVHFPSLLTLRTRWIDLSSVGSAAASDLVNTIMRMKYVTTLSLLEKWRHKYFFAHV